MAVQQSQIWRDECTAVVAHSSCCAWHLFRHFRPSSWQCLKWSKKEAGSLRHSEVKRRRLEDRGGKWSNAATLSSVGACALRPASAAVPSGGASCFCSLICNASHPPFVQSSFTLYPHNSASSFFTSNVASRVIFNHHCIANLLLRVRW